jgi:tetratricopeptide (TPR) repeat protein
MDETRIAERLLDVAHAQAKKTKSKALPALIRRRAALAEDESIDDDLPSLHRATKRIAEAAALPDATAADHARLGWALLMTSAPGKAKAAAPNDALVLAGIAWAKRPSPEGVAAMVRAAGPDLERVVRLLVQRSQPALDLARELYAERTHAAALPARETLRALRLLVAAAHAQRAPDAAELARLDPRHGTSALRPRLERLARVKERFGGGEHVLLPLIALAKAATDAGDHGVAAEAGERIDEILAPNKTQAARYDRSLHLGHLASAYIALSRYDDALGAVERDDAIRRALGHPSPDHHTRAKVAEARGDWDACIDEHRRAVQLFHAHAGPGYGPEGSNTRLAEGWLTQAEARRDKSARGPRG